MRSRYALALVVLAGVLAGVVATSGAEFSCFRSSANASACEGRVTFAVTGDVRPRELPERGTAPITLAVRGAIANEGGGHPPALRELGFDLDRNVRLDATAFPVCRAIRSGYDVRRDLRVECPDSIVGRGTAEISFASGRPSERVPLTFFNAGVVDGATGLVVQTTVIVPLQTVLKVERAVRGRYGHTATWFPSPIAGGDGSLTKFSFRLKRGYARARCTDGKLQASITRARFRNEGGGAKTVTVLSGMATAPCTPSPGNT